MQAKILFVVLSALALGSCSTAYKSGQTPDDVYYSPVRIVEEKQETKRYDAPEKFIDYGIMMPIRDYRWRYFNDDYSYWNSPYKYYSYSGYHNYGYYNNPHYGYYYNPYYNTWPIYITNITPTNRIPRMVNLNAYSGLNDNKSSVNSKNINSINWSKPSTQYYNNSNNINRDNNRKNISSYDKPSTSETRTYTPSSNNSGSGTKGNSSSGSGNSGSVTRPPRGG